MSQTLSINRLGKYATFELQTGYHRMLFVMCTYIAILVILMCIPLYFGNYEHRYSIRLGYDIAWDNIEDLVYIGFFVCCTFGASYTFANLSDKYSRISSLMLPASSLEKYIIRWLISVPFNIVMFVVSFGIADIIRYVVTIIHLPQHDGLSLFFNNTDFIRNLFAVNQGYISVFIMFAIQSIFVLGSSIWPKRSLIKTAIAIFVIDVVLVLYGGWLTTTLCDKSMYYNINNSLIEEYPYLTSDIVLFGFGIILMTLSYYRYKEIEIIQRW